MEAAHSRMKGRHGVEYMVVALPLLTREIFVVPTSTVRAKSGEQTSNLPGQPVYGPLPTVLSAESVRRLRVPERLASQRLRRASGEVRLLPDGQTQPTFPVLPSPSVAVRFVSSSQIVRPRCSNQSRHPTT